MEIISRARPKVLAHLHQAVQNKFYNHVHRRVDDDVVFMNWSYEDVGLVLDDADEPNRYPINLYHVTATQGGPLRGKRVLEVGCGRGGGASYLTRHLQPVSYVGVDINAAAVAFCQRRHQVAGLSFMESNAEDLPFADAEFDAVVNVESSHCYPHFDRFLSEVARVLRPGGSLLHTDVRLRSECAQWESDLARPPLRIVSSRDIGAEVLRGMESNSAQMEAAMETLVPRFLRGWARDAAPARDSALHRELASGRQVYRLYHLTKTTPLLSA